VKTVTLECGGKNPIVVFPDADLDAALEGVVRGMNFSFSGQSCGSTSRLIVHEEIHESFVGALAERIDGLTVGLPEDDATQVGALVSEAQLDKVSRYVELGKAEGAQLIAGGTRPAAAELANGFFIRPALFDGVDPRMRLAQEEIFGPVLAVMPFRDETEALAIANDIRFGLTASIYTRDLRRAHTFARDVAAGFVWVNDSGRHFLGTPFGGFKESGLGREEDTEELYSYTQTKNVNVLFE
jgi:betaine-aldehyde dehydrogenase